MLEQRPSRLADRCRRKQGTGLPFLIKEAWIKVQCLIQIRRNMWMALEHQ